jgi:hypothetical protein
MRNATITLLDRVAAGNYSDLSRRLKLPKAAIFTWKARGTVHSRHWEALAQVGREKGIEIVAADFLVAENASEIRLG